MEQEFENLPLPYLTSDKTSHAYPSVKDQWPKIVTGTIDDVHRTVVSSPDNSRVKEGKSIIAGLATLKYELQHDRRLTPLANDGQRDIDDYNNKLDALGAVKWFSAPWLFAECYLYRRIHTFFSLSTHWKTYDVFARQKLSQLRSSRSAVLELAAKYKTLIASTSSNTSGKQNDAAEAASFTEMCSLHLEANINDHRFPSTLTSSSSKDLQDPSVKDTTGEGILVNDLPAAYKTLKATQLSGKADRSISIVPSTAGLPLFASLLFSSYLLTTNLATQIIVHPKSFPCFVTDATPADFASLLSLLADPRTFFTAPSEEDALTDESSAATLPLTAPEVENLAFIFQHLAALYAEGKIVLRPQPFWTSPFSYWDLPNRASELFADLREAELVVFMGDSHYRKLTADAKWPSTTTFGQAIGPLGKGSGVRVLSLRKCVADGTVLGLDEAAVENLKYGIKETQKRNWGIVQCYDGKS